jgi:hypothetical protein
MAGVLNPRPIVRTLFARQSAQISYADILKMEILPADSIQNDDGTFKPMLGYDPPIAMRLG